MSVCAAPEQVTAVLTAASVLVGASTAALVELGRLARDRRKRRRGERLTRSEDP